MTREHKFSAKFSGRLETLLSSDCLCYTSEGDLKLENRGGETREPPGGTAKWQIRFCATRRASILNQRATLQTQLSHKVCHSLRRPNETRHSCCKLLIRSEQTKAQIIQMTDSNSAGKGVQYQQHARLMCFSSSRHLEPEGGLDRFLSWQLVSILSVFMFQHIVERWPEE